MKGDEVAKSPNGDCKVRSSRYKTPTHGDPPEGWGVQAQRGQPRGVRCIYSHVGTTFLSANTRGEARDVAHVCVQHRTGRQRRRRTFYKAVKGLIAVDGYRQALFLLFISAVGSAMGCASLTARFTAPLIPPMMESFFSECDPEIARQALPSQCKLMEGLLKADPSNKDILKGLSSGYAGYALLFVEDESSDRASALYLRARDYGLRSLGDLGERLKNGAGGEESVRKALLTADREILERLFWTAVAWSGWISLQGDNPTAISQIWILRLCLERIIEINPDFFHGTPYALLGSLLAFTPPLLGGDPSKARDDFDRAMEASGGRFLLIQYFYARYGAVRLQDRQLFLRLLESIGGSDESALKEMCLINMVFKEKASRLKAREDELFY